MSQPKPPPDPGIQRMDAILVKAQSGITEQYRNMLGFRGPPAVMMLVHIRSFFGEMFAKKDSWFAGYAQTTCKDDHCWIAMGLTLREFLPIWASASQAKTKIALGSVELRDFVQKAEPDELPIIFFHEDRPNITVASVGRAAYS